MEVVPLVDYNDLVSTLSARCIEQWVAAKISKAIHDLHVYRSADNILHRKIHENALEICRFLVNLTFLI